MFKRKKTIDLATIEHMAKTTSREIENGHADVQLSTLYKLFQGVGRKISVAVL